VSDIEIVTEFLLSDHVIHLHRPKGWLDDDVIKARLAKATPRDRSEQGQTFGTRWYDNGHIRSFITPDQVQVWRRLVWDAVGSRNQLTWRQIGENRASQEYGDQEERRALFAQAYVRCEECSERRWHDEIMQEMMMTKFGRRMTHDGYISPRNAVMDFEFHSR